jgi:HlyD family secretion protein
MPGRSAQVEITIDSRKGVPSLPIEAVFDEDGQRVVYVAAGSGMKKTEVKTGLSDNNRIEILGGVKPGDKVSKVRPLAGSTLDQIKKSKEHDDGWW